MATPPCKRREGSIDSNNVQRNFAGWTTWSTRRRVSDSGDNEVEEQHCFFPSLDDYKVVQV